MIINILPVIISLGGGVVVGGALAAFISLLEIIPRLIQISNTNKYITYYQYAFTLGAIFFIATYFSGKHMNFGVFIAGTVGLIMGIFTGLFSSALTEVLSVLPVISKKFKIVNDLKWIIYAMLAGKVLGSLYYWTIFW